MLVEAGIITKDELLEYLQKQHVSKKRLGQILIEEGKLTEKQLYEILEKIFNVKFETSLEIPSEEKISILFSLVPMEFCRKKLIAPIDISNDFIIIAIDNPSDFDTISEVRFLTSKHVGTKFATESAIREYLDTIQNYLKTGKIVSKKHEEKKETKVEVKTESKVVEIVNNIIAEGINKKASDIHLEIYDESVVLRYRIDGKLYKFEPPPLELYPSIVSRIKIMANLDISERRLPQDGSIKFIYNGKDVDIRVSVIPGIFGENVVMRILSKDTNIISDITRIGMTPEEVKLYKDALSKPNGMILVTGPTGSGKTTTLYAGIMYLKQFEKKIITAEDPVEYQINGVEQIQVNPEIGFTFAQALRAFLRHDPDIIMVGEIRDTETAEIAIRAALTGHLVLSTLHTNDAPSALTRLVDMGIPPYLVASTVNFIIAQRLVRKLCEYCKGEAKVDLSLDPELKKYFSPNEKVYIPTGCNRCNKTGFSGRIPIFEILVVNDEIKNALLRNASSFELKEIATKNGMKTLRESGFEKVKKGLTTIEEVLGVS